VATRWGSRKSWGSWSIAASSRAKGFSRPVAMKIFPRGLPVGVVEKVVRDPDQDGFIRVIVKPGSTPSTVSMKFS